MNKIVLLKLIIDISFRLQYAIKKKQLPGITMTSQIYTEMIKTAQEERPVPHFDAIVD